MDEQALGELSRLVRQYQDRIEITDLCAHYGYAIDDRDLDKFCMLFTPDGTNSGRKVARRSGPSLRIDSTSGACRCTAPCRMSSRLSTKTTRRASSRATRRCRSRASTGSRQGATRTSTNETKACGASLSARRSSTTTCA